jgi:GNAT superfamily N-acetyltransferase
MRAGLFGTAFRPARPDEIPECGRIWREACNDYLRPLNQREVPEELGPIGRLHAHTHATDPDGFVVATRPVAAGRAGGSGGSGERIVGFGSAVVRGDVEAGFGVDRLWFLSMLFIRPEAQGQGLGAAILERLLPEPGFAGALATVVDSIQPISAALYGKYAIVPRMPMLNLAGEIRGADAFSPLPSGVTPVPFEAIAAGPPDGPGHRELVRIVDQLDRESLGVTHPQDHRYLREEGRRGFIYRGPDDAALGYGYAGTVGRVGPIAVRDPALLEPVVGHLTRAVPTRGATAIWVPGGAHRLLSTLLHAGLRLDEFPVLLSWDRPFADFARYLPMSPGLL